MKKYLLDTNIYIDFYDRFYLPAHFPTFWSNFIRHINEFVIVPRVVLDEIQQNEWIKDWIKEHFDSDIVKHTDYAVELQEVLSHIQAQPHYTDNVLVNWSREKIADSWLLAIAKKEGFVIVTNETANPNLHTNPNPSKSAKIPDVANELGIECISRNEFFARIDLKV